MNDDPRMTKLREIAQGDPDEGRRAKAADLLKRKADEMRQRLDSMDIETEVPDDGPPTARFVPPADDKPAPLVGKATGATEGGEFHRAAAGLTRSALGGATFGLGPKALDVAGVGDASTIEDVKQYQRDRPVANAAAGLVGLMAGGARVVGEGAQRAVGDALVKRGVPGAISRVAGGAAGGAAGAASQTLPESLVAGQNLGEAMGQTGRSMAVGAGLGGAGALVGEVARAASPQVAQNADATLHGRYDTDEMRGVMAGGREAAASKSANLGRDQVLGSLKAQRAAESKAYGAALDDALAAQPAADAAPIEKRLTTMLRENRVIDPASPTGLGEIRDEGLERALRKTISLIPRTPDGKIDARNLLAARKAVFAEAQAADPKEAGAWKQVYGAMTGGIHEASPGIKAADEMFAAGKAKRNRILDVLGSTDENAVSGQSSKRAEGFETDEIDFWLDASKEKQLARGVRRMAEEGRPGQDAAEQVGEITRLDPTVARAAERQRDVLAKGATEYSLKAPSGLETMTNITGFLPMVSQNARAAGATIANRAPQSAGLAANPEIMALIDKYLKSLPVDEKPKKQANFSGDIVELLSNAARKNQSRGATP